MIRRSGTPPLGRSALVVALLALLGAGTLRAEAPDTAASEEEKKTLVARKLKLYQEAAKRSEADKSAATAAMKVLYTKAYGMYCTPAKITTDEVCTNALMKKMYGKPKAMA